MLYREIITVFSQIRTKHINTLCGQNVELLNVKLAVHISRSTAAQSTAVHSHNCSCLSRCNFLCAVRDLHAWL